MITAVIANGESLSTAVSLKPNQTAARIKLPAAWTAAVVAFQVSNDEGVSYGPLYDGNGDEYFLTVDAGRNVLLDPAVFGSIHTFKLQSGKTSALVNQGEERTIEIAVG